MKTLDFVVVGAQKSGTTALHQYASSHPQIYLPKGKEAPFFNRDDFYEKGLPYYIKNTFPGEKHENTVWGKISPQYMCNTLVAKRVHNDLPNTTVIAILRDPIKRAISHYKMTQKRGLEQREINSAFIDLLEPNQLSASRELISNINNESNCYIAWSEYGRILDFYRELYGTNPHILYFEDMIESPHKFIKNFFRLIGVNDEFIPQNLGEKVFSSDGGQIGILKKIRDRSTLKSLWRLLPLPFRSKLYFYTEQSLSKIPSLSFHKESPNKNFQLNDEIILRLQSHFKSDITSSCTVKPHSKWNL